MSNNRERDAIIAVQEERARIGGVEVTRQTLIAATDEGLVFLNDSNSLSWNSLCEVERVIYTCKSAKNYLYILNRKVLTNYFENRYCRRYGKRRSLILH